MTDTPGENAPGRKLTVVDESDETRRPDRGDDSGSGSRRSTFRIAVPEDERAGDRLRGLAAGDPTVDSTVVAPGRTPPPNARRGTVALNLEDVLDDEEADGLSTLERLSGQLDLPAVRPEVPRERRSSDKPAAELDHYIRIIPASDPYAGATFKDVDVVLIGRRPDQDIYVEHDLVDGNHAEITYRDGVFEIAPVAGSLVYVGDKRVDERRALCRGDEFTLVGPGGPRFTVEMLKPDREPGRPPSRLPLLLRWLSPIIDPLAARHDLPPLFVLTVGLVVLTPILIGLFLLYLLWQENRLVPEVTPRMMIQSWSERSASAPVSSEQASGAQGQGRDGPGSSSNAGSTPGARTPGARTPDARTPEARTPEARTLA